MVKIVSSASDRSRQDSGSRDWSLRVIRVLLSFAFHCISVSAPDKYAILTLADLVDHRPLYCHQCSFPDGMVQKYIRLAYHVFKM